MAFKRVLNLVVRHDELGSGRTPRIATSMCPPRIMANDSLESKFINQQNCQECLGV